MSRYTPLPPIASPKTASETEKESSGGNDGEDDEEYEEFDLSNVSMENIFAELSRILPSMATKVTVKQASYLCSVGNKTRNPVQGDQLGRHLASLNFVESFQRHWRDNFEKVVPDTCGPLNWYTAKALLFVMWNMSGACTIICERILKVELHSDLLNFLKSKHLKPNLMNDEKPSYIVQAFIGIMHNVVQRASEARESLRACDAVERIQPFRECNNRMVSCVSLMIQSYLVTEAENEKINSNDEVFELLVELLNAAIKQESFMGIEFDAFEVLEVLNKLAANDKNKYRIVKSGALPYYVDLMGPKWTPREQAEAAYGLWILAFKCKDEINKEPGCVKALKALLESSDEQVKKEAVGALWILEEKNEPPPETETTGAGSVLEAMATAVEKAVIVVICLSEKYKDSPNCRTEAEYTFRLKKKIIPIRLQTKYYPDGWLGIMVGSKLVLDFSDSFKARENTKRLIKELGDVGKGMDETDAVKSVSVPINNALIYSSHDKSSPVKYWTKEDVSEWITKNNLEHIKDWFSSFTGSLLLEYNEMRHEAPEAFFAYLMQNNISLSDALAISQALKNL